MCCFFFFSSRRRHTRFDCDWSSDVCSSDLLQLADLRRARWRRAGGQPFRTEAIDLREVVLHRVVAKIGRASCRESVDLGGRRIIKKEKMDEGRAHSMLVKGSGNASAFQDSH